MFYLHLLCLLSDRTCWFEHNDGNVLFYSSDTCCLSIAQELAPSDLKVARAVNTRETLKELVIRDKSGMNANQRWQHMKHLSCLPFHPSRNVPCYLSVLCSSCYPSLLFCVLLSIIISLTVPMIVVFSNLSGRSAANSMHTDHLSNACANISYFMCCPPYFREQPSVEKHPIAACVRHRSSQATN